MINLLISLLCGILISALTLITVLSPALMVYFYFFCENFTMVTTTIFVICSIISLIEFFVIYDLLLELLRYIIQEICYFIWGE